MHVLASLYTLCHDGGVPRYRVCLVKVFNAALEGLFASLVTPHDPLSKRLQIANKSLDDMLQTVPTLRPHTLSGAGGQDSGACRSG